MSMSCLLALTLVAVLVATQAVAQALPKPEEVVQLRATPTEFTLSPTGTATLKLIAEIRPGFHINSNKPLQEYLIPTEVFLPETFELAEVNYPPALLKRFPFAPDEDVAVFAGTLQINLRLRAVHARSGRYRLKITLRYQACNDRICLRPALRTVEVSVNVGASNKPHQRNPKAS